MGTERLDDEAQLQALGHKGELERNFSLLSMLGLAFAILNSWTALSASIGLALPSGGSTSVIWGLVTAGICNLALAASLAEFLSAYPTAGGQYVHTPASRDIPNLITDTTGLRSSPQNAGYP
jgi:choline transport protein